MKKLITILLFSCLVGITQAQNFQFLKAKDVNFVTAELFKPLEHGKFYYFTDFKIDKDGYFDSYTEISKYWNVNRNGLSVTTQYNAGIFTYDGSTIRVKPVYLFGVSKEVVVNDYILSLDVLYRIDEGTNLDVKIGQGVQLTGIFLRDWDSFQISGYCDLWQTVNSQYYNINRNSLIVQFEPQAWWKFSKRVFLGVEGRISNFNDVDLGLGDYANYVMVGLKWNLEL